MSTRLDILVFRLLLVSNHFSALICQPGERPECGRTR
jgi:hypothetical protein